MRQVLAHRLRQLRREVAERWREGGLHAVLTSRKAWGIVLGTLAQGLKPRGVKLDARAWTDAIVEAEVARAARGGGTEMDPNNPNNVTAKGSKTVLGAVLLALGVLLHVVAALPFPTADSYDTVVNLGAGMLVSAGIATFGYGLRHAIEKTRATLHVATEAIDQALAEIAAKAPPEDSGTPAPTPFRPRAA